MLLLNMMLGVLVVCLMYEKPYHCHWISNAISLEVRNAFL